MDRIHHPSAIATPPSVDAHATPGYPTEGNPIGGIEATVMTAWIGHSLIEEQRAVIVAAGITPDKATLTQLRQAIAVLIGKSMQVFLASGSFTVPAGVYRIRGRVWGGGGGGGGGGAGGAGSGGGGGGYAEGWYDVTPGQVIAVTVGAAGTAGIQSGANGGAGGSSSLGSLLSATGGAGGLSTTTSVKAGVAGGTGTGGAVNITGQPTAASYQIGSTFLGSGGGGGGLGGAGTPQTVDNGLNGMFPGGGASGSVGGWNGGAGAAGLVIVEW